MEQNILLLVMIEIMTMFYLQIIQQVLLQMEKALIWKAARPSQNSHPVPGKGVWERRWL